MFARYRLFELLVARQFNKVRGNQQFTGTLFRYRYRVVYDVFAEPKEIEIIAKKFRILKYL